MLLPISSEWGVTASLPDGPMEKPDVQSALPVILSHAWPNCPFRIWLSPMGKLYNFGTAKFKQMRKCYGIATSLHGCIDGNAGNQSALPLMLSHACINYFFRIWHSPIGRLYNLGTANFERMGKWYGIIRQFPDGSKGEAWANHHRRWCCSYTWLKYPFLIWPMLPPFSPTPHEMCMRFYASADLQVLFGCGREKSLWLVLGMP